MPNIKLLAFISLLTLCCPLEAKPNPWAAIQHPTSFKGQAQSIGTYDAGCLSNAVPLPTDGTGYQVMRLSRNRFYGHPDLKLVIETLGKQVGSKHLGTLLIGDLSQPRGGPTLTGHRSHQTGLDADIWFLLSSPATSRPLTPTERETLNAPSVIAANSDGINKNQWTNTNGEVLALAAESPLVDRIFVNAGVKRELCKNYRGQVWLQKIRPWWKHEDHFHMRLKCPIGNNNCLGQPPLPAGDGCDASLDWWFSDEAKKPPVKPYKPKEPELPGLCQMVLQQR